MVYPALVMNTFESRGAAVILRNVGCNSSLTELSQCVSPEEIYAVPNYRTSCGYTRAGVKCANLSDSITVTFVNGESTSETLDLSTNILPMSAILGAVVGSAALVILIIIIVVVTIIVALTRNRNTTKGKKMKFMLHACTYIANFKPKLTVHVLCMHGHRL